MTPVAVLRNSVLIDAPAATVLAAVRETTSGLLVRGDEVRRPRLPLMRVLRADGAHLEVRGPRVVFGALATPTTAGTLLVEAVRWQVPVPLTRRRVLQSLTARADRIRRRAEELAGLPAIVGAAVVRDGRLLVAQRGHPAAHEGRWELPGGRVEAGESDHTALARECREELGVDIEADAQVGCDLPIAGVGVLRVHAAGLTVTSAEPRAVEHRAVRWIGPAELAELDWLPADRWLLPDLSALLRRPAPVSPPARDPGP